MQKISMFTKLHEIFIDSQDVLVLPSAAATTNTTAVQIIAPV
jgi:hypothetical protein